MQFRQILKSVAPAPVVRAVRYTRALRDEWSLRDYKRQLFGDQTNLVPPLRLMHDGPAEYLEFKQNGLEFFGHYKNLCGLQPHHKILDVGCGIGRKALPLLSFLGPEGLYEGIDIVPSGIRWCKTRIQSRYPNFHFQQSDIQSKYYNPAGRLKPSEYRFPFRNATFDLVILTSVFTHMIPEDMAHYFSEIQRVLAHHGKALITYLLLNEQSLDLMQRGQATWGLKPWQDCRVLDINDPEHLIAHPEAHVLELYRENGLRIIPPIHYGSWSGRPDYLSFQDIIVAEKS